MLGKRHGYGGHGFAGAIVACGVETRRFCSWVSAVGLLRFACFGCALGAGVLQLGLHQRRECLLLYRGFGQGPFWLRHATFLLHVVLHWLMLPHGALASLRGWCVATS